MNIGLKIIKKDGTIVDFDEQKIISAINKSANRVLLKLTDADFDLILKSIKKILKKQKKEILTVEDIHCSVEITLDSLFQEVAKSYRDYRNYKSNCSQTLSFFSRFLYLA